MWENTSILRVMVSKTQKLVLPSQCCEISRSDGGEDEDSYPLGCAV